METRTARLIVGHSGGTAGAGSLNYKIALPTKWIERLGLGANDREIELTLDGGRIIITPRLTAEGFAANAVKLEHSVYKFSFFDGDRLCSVIFADFNEKQIRAENYTDNLVKTAFGRNFTPSWEDFREFLAERCIPASRSGLNEYLEAVGADSSDPLDILPITQGRMAGDDQRLIMEKLK